MPLYVAIVGLWCAHLGSEAGSLVRGLLPYVILDDLGAGLP